MARAGLRRKVLGDTKLPMKTILRAVATLELLFVFPAVLFMTALFVRNIQPLQYEPAHTAQRVVALYASSTHIGLWVLLIALPFAVVIIGSATLIREWRRNHELRDATLGVVGFISLTGAFYPDRRCNGRGWRDSRHRCSTRAY